MMFTGSMSNRRLIAAIVFVTAAAAASVAVVMGMRSISGEASPTSASTAGTASRSAAETEPALGGDRPATPIHLCNGVALQNAPVRAPAGAIVVPAGDNSSLVESDLRQPGRTFYFASGIHTLGPSQYGQIIPGAGSSFIGAPGAVLDGQKKNLYAFTGEAADVTIEFLTVRNFGTGRSNNDQGVVNHDRGAGWTMRYNMFTQNDGAAVMLGSRNALTMNCLKDNGQYGFSAVPAQDASVVSALTIDRNEISGNNTDDWERRRDGCGCTGGGKLWQVNGAMITRNYVHDNRGPGLWADNDNRDILFELNYIAGNDGHGIEYEVSYNFAIRKNTFIHNALVEGAKLAKDSDTFPVGAIYVSESGGDRRAGAAFATSEITDNLFENNWDGIILWENADRFCRPDEEFDTTNGCPFFDHNWGARYKTQNIRITGNTFVLDKAAIGCTALCGRQAMISNYGTVPSNSPYMGETIQDAITFHQNNVWSNNSYTGPWQFIAHDLGRQLTLAQWQSTPYQQDAGSTPH